MYGLDWIERRTLRGARPNVHVLAPVHPMTWKLGLTSLLTDISSEMVSSLLPVYLVLHLRMSTLQYGAIDGIYNGIAVALLSLAGGVVADRTRRRKEVAAFGYGIAALCKLLLLAAGAAWVWIAAIIALDRAGKGIRTAPRDALISLHNSRESLASAFAVHRAMDAGGALLGPLIAFALLSQMPGAFDAIWLTSFVFAFLGLAVLWLFVQNPPSPDAAPAHSFSWRSLSSALAGRGFWALALAGAFLSAMTLSDGFLYLLLQRRSGLAIGYFPLFYVITACCYMVFSIPMGQVADRWGRTPVFLLGYVAVGLIYVLLLSSPGFNMPGIMACLLLLGFHYAATQGVLMAMGSSVIPAHFRTSGLALLATWVGGGKLVSSLLFGWLWQVWGIQVAVSVMGAALLAALPLCVYLLGKSRAARAA